MPRFYCLAWIPPERLPQSDAGLIRTRWRLDEDDRERGLRGFYGEFRSRDEATAELTPAVGASDPSDVDLLIASPEIGEVVDSGGRWPPVWDTGRPGKIGAVVVETPEPEQSPATEEPAGEEPPEKEPPAKKSGDKVFGGPGTTPVTNGGDMKSPEAQTITAGLAGLEVPEKLWNLPSSTEKPTLANEVLRDLYSERSAYARNVRWSVAPDAELWSFLSDNDRAELAKEAIRRQLRMLEHQVDLEKLDVDARQKEIDAAEEAVQLRKQTVAQQVEVTKMLEELLAHLKMWTSLANTGRLVLWATVGFSCLAVAALLWMAWDSKFDDWATLPLAIFAIALFAISPAVLLILGRPLKGLDEWAPGSGGGGTGSSGDGETRGQAPKSEASSAPDNSTLAYGQTNQPKGYGPDGRLRT